MDLGAILLLLAVVVLVALFVSAPFLERKRQITPTKEERQLSAYLAERDRVINALQELDFDNTLGKIPGEDYSVQRASLLVLGTDVLRKIDAFSSGPGSQRPRAQGAEDRLEAAIAARRADAAVGREAGPVSSSDDELEELIASRRSLRKEKSAGFCPNCGKPVAHSDRFCPNCGKSLQ